MDIKIDGDSAKKAWSWSLTVVRWALLIILPGLIAGFAGFAGMRTEDARRNFIVAAAISAIVLASMNVYVEIRNRRNASAAKKDIENLAIRLGQSGHPLIMYLNEIAATPNPDARRIQTQTLVARTLDLANQHCGSFAGTNCETRTSFYAFDGPNRLIRKEWVGREGRAPRTAFVAEPSNRSDSSVIERARGEDPLLVGDVDKDPPAHFADYRERGYKSMLFVPVRTKEKSFGFLSVDSDKPNSLTKADVSYLKLMAAIVAAAFVLEESCENSKGPSAVLPRQADRNEASSTEEGAK